MRKDSKLKYTCHVCGKPSDAPITCKKGACIKDSLERTMNRVTELLVTLGRNQPAVNIIPVGTQVEYVYFHWIHMKSQFAAVRFTCLSRGNRGVKCPACEAAKKDPQKVTRAYARVRFTVLTYAEKSAYPVLAVMGLPIGAYTNFAHVLTNVKRGTKVAAVQVTRDGEGTGIRYEFMLVDPPAVVMHPKFPWVDIRAEAAALNLHSDCISDAVGMRKAIKDALC